MHNYNRPLTEKEKEICGYTGFFGVLISLTCLIQQFSFIGPRWALLMIAGIYVVSLVCFIFLAIKNEYAPLLMIVNSSLLLFQLLFLVFNHLYSLALFLLFLYSIIMVLVLYIEHYPAKLKAGAEERRREQSEWRDRV